MLDVSQWQEGPTFSGDNAEEARIINEMAKEASAYVRSHKWAPEIATMYLVWAIGNVIALFLVRFANNIKKSPDNELWVVVGDLPSAYFVTDDTTSAHDALNVYCNLMEDWVDAVKGGKPLNEVFPVQAKSTIDHADALVGRLHFIRRELLPDI
jgi:hypothetical protein